MGTDAVLMGMGIEEARSAGGAIRITSPGADVTVGEDHVLRVSRI